ncbi:hypothetical protein KAU86_05090 [bacterium]|nr:hypothetical protein [bacterium]
MRGNKYLITSIGLLLVIFCLSCAHRSKITRQSLPKTVLAKTIAGIEFSVVDFGVARDWSQLEVAISNNREEPVYVETKKIYLLTEKGYYIEPYSDREITKKMQIKTGKLVTPLTLSTLAVGVGALIAPGKKDREALGKATVALAAGALAHEGLKRETASKDEIQKKDFGFKDKKVPTQLKIGGIIYYPPIERAYGAKAYLDVEGEEVIFEIKF